MTRMGPLLGTRIRLTITALLAASAMFAIGFSSTAQAQEFTVTSLADSEDPGTLRTALNDVVGSIDIENRIVFAPGLTGTINLSSPLPPFPGTLEIEGPGAEKLAIDGGDEHPIFTGEGDVAISDLSLENGYYAASLQNGTAVLDGVTIESSGVGGGVVAAGSNLTIRDSRLIDNEAPMGAGLSVSESDVTVSNSVFSGNQAGFGAGILVYGGEEDSIEIDGSSFTNNTATTGGGGLAVFTETLGEIVSTKVAISDSTFTGNKATAPVESGAGGGGIYSSSTDITIDSSLFDRNTSGSAAGAIGIGAPFPANKASISNSTFTGNSAEAGAGAIFSVAGGMKIDSSTIVGNSTTNPINPQYGGAGLVAAYVPATVRNTIISGNTPTDISTFSPSEEAKAEVKGSFNLIGKMPEADYTETVSGSDITSSTPKLGALADNGGPTKTMAPAASSPVVNKGLSYLDTDQRGLLRPVKFGSIPFSKAKQANGADIGAVELQSNTIRFGKVKLNKKQGTATLPVILPTGGKVTLKGSSTVKGQTKSTKKAATVKFQVKAKGKALKKLRKAGTVKVKLAFTFRPTGGIASSKNKTIRLAMKKKRRG